MSSIEAVSVVVPSLNPSGMLIAVVAGLIETGFSDIIVVNDGSEAEYSPTFDKLGGFPQCTVLTHERNMGKGAALKTGFSYFLSSRPDGVGIVTMDGDGQHLASDAAKCALSMTQHSGSITMGVRDFHHPDVPTHNSLGNRLMSFSFRILFGLKLRDTQTGMRGIPAPLVQQMLRIPGNRFDYETNMLLEMKRLDIPYNEVEIETVYEEGSNKRSHFRPFVDAAAIFLRITKYAMSSLISFLIDIGVFWLTLHFLGPFIGTMSIPVCTVIARLFSSFVNFNINRLFVFKRKQSFGNYLWRYYTLAIILMLTSAFVLWAIAQLFDSVEAAGLVTLLKVTVDFILFFFNYYVQQHWVFKTAKRQSQ